MVQAFAFYLFAGILFISALMVITSRNPVHSVLFLILSFFNAAGLFVLLGAEFIAFILVIVYVGAVAVLFLFVVMMLNIDFANLRKDAMQYVPLGLLIGGILLGELISTYKIWLPPRIQGDMPATQDNLTNTEIIGQVLYTDYLVPFQLAGLVLLVAMIGAISLTLRIRPGVRKQNVADQFKRTPEESMEIKKVESGKGIS